MQEGILPMMIIFRKSDVKMIILKDYGDNDKYADDNDDNLEDDDDEVYC